MLLRILLNKLISPLKQYESALIDALAEKLNSEASSLLLEQIKRVNYIQRHNDQKEVNLYCIKYGKPFFHEKLRFLLKQSETKFASVTFEVTAISKTFRADIWLVNGYLFSIEFNSCPKKIKNNNIEIKEIIILKLRITTSCGRGALRLCL